MRSVVYFIRSGSVARIEEWEKPLESGFLEPLSLSPSASI